MKKWLVAFLLLSLLGECLLCAQSVEKDRDARKEIERFFAEYGTAASPEQKKEKLAAALALNPMNEIYRYEELQWIFEYRCPLGTEEVRKAVEQTFRFCKDFPDSKRRVWDMRMTYALRNDLTPSADELFAVIRRERQAESRRLIQIDPKAEFKTPGDIKKYTHYLASIIIERYYRSAISPDYLKDNREYTLDYIKKINAYIDKHPEDAGAVEKIGLAVGLTPMPESVFQDIYSSQVEDFYVDYYLSLNDFTAELNRAKLAPLRFEKLRIMMIQNLIRAGNDEAAIRKIYFDCFSMLDQEFPGFTSGGSGAYSNWRGINIFLGTRTLSFWSVKRLGKDETFGCELLVEYLTRSGREISLPGLKALFGVVMTKINESIIRQLIAAAPLIRKHGYDFLTIRSNSVALPALFNNLYSKESSISRSLRTELFTAINQPFEFTEIPTERILAVTQYGKFIYLICYQRDEDLRFYEFDCDAACMRLLSTFPGADVDIYDYTARFLKVSPQYIVFSGPDFIWVGERGNDAIKWHQLKELPPQFSPSGLEILNDRIYLLDSNKIYESQKTKMLISMDMEGGKRKIHFSSARVEELSPLDIVKNGVAAKLFRQDEKRFLFAMFLNDRTELWGFDVALEKFTKIATVPESYHCYMNYDDSAMWVLCNYGGSIYRVDPSNGAWEHFFHGQHRIWDGSKPRYQMLGERQIDGPVMIRNGKLWIGGQTQFCVDLENPRQTQMLAMRKSSDIFEYHGKIFFIALDTIYVFQVVPDAPTNAGALSIQP